MAFGFLSLWVPLSSFTLKLPSLSSSPVLSKEGQKYHFERNNVKVLSNESWCTSCLPSVLQRLLLALMFLLHAADLGEVFDVKIWNSQEYVGSKCSLVRCVFCILLWIYNAILFYLLGGILKGVELWGGQRFVRELCGRGINAKFYTKRGFLIFKVVCTSDELLNPYIYIYISLSSVLCHLISLADYFLQ